MLPHPGSADGGEYEVTHERQLRARLGDVVPEPSVCLGNSPQELATSLALRFRPSPYIQARRDGGGLLEIVHALVVGWFERRQQAGDVGRSLTRSQQDGHSRPPGELFCVQGDQRAAELHGERDIDGIAPS